jgi:hypothetical protein
VPLIAATRDVTSPVVRYAFFVELGCGLVFAAFSGVRVESLCVAKCVAATLVAGGFAAYVAVVRPARERIDHWFALAFAVLQAATAAILTGAAVGNRRSGTAPWTNDAVEAARTVSLVTLGLPLLQAVIALVSAVCATSRPPVECDDAGSDPRDTPLLEVPSRIRETPSTCALPHVKEVRTSVASIMKADTENSVAEASVPQALTTTVAPANPLEQRRGARTRS